VNDETIQKNSLNANPQLDHAKVKITTGYLNPPMILTPVDLDAAQEIEKLSPRDQEVAKANAKSPAIVRRIGFRSINSPSTCRSIYTSGACVFGSEIIRD